jgi:hypothetical protein
VEKKASESERKALNRAREAKEVMQAEDAEVRALVMDGDGGEEPGGPALKPPAVGCAVVGPTG